MWHRKKDFEDFSLGKSRCVQENKITKVFGSTKKLQAREGEERRKNNPVSTSGNALKFGFSSHVGTREAEQGEELSVWVLLGEPQPPVWGHTPRGHGCGFSSKSWHRVLGQFVDSVTLPAPFAVVRQWIACSGSTSACFPAPGRWDEILPRHHRSETECVIKPSLEIKKGLRNCYNHRSMHLL